MSEQVKDYPSYLDYPKPRKKQTNADKIRAMTDEQLADWLCIHIECRNCEADESGYGGCDEYCRAVLFDWLKQEVNENAAQT